MYPRVIEILMVGGQDCKPGGGLVRLCPEKNRNVNNTILQYDAPRTEPRLRRRAEGNNNPK